LPSWRNASARDENSKAVGDAFEIFVEGSVALVMALFIGNRECPTGRAASNSAPGEKRSCVVRWKGTKFTYKPL